MVLTLYHVPSKSLISVMTMSSLNACMIELRMYFFNSLFNSFGTKTFHLFYIPLRSSYVLFEHLHENICRNRCRIQFWLKYLNFFYMKPYSSYIYSKTILSIHEFVLKYFVGQVRDENANHWLLILQMYHNRTTFCQIKIFLALSTLNKSYLSFH